MDYLSLEDLQAIPADKLPMMVLSDNLMGLFGLMIKLVTKSFYSHFMWLLPDGKMATQWFWYRIQPVSAFSHNSLKLFWCPTWTATERTALQQWIDAELKKGKWATRYDVLGVIGQFLSDVLPGNWDWMQDKKHDFCSERIRCLALVDPEALKWLESCPSPTPEEVNTWLKAQRNPDGSEKYPVYCRVVPGE